MTKIYAYSLITLSVISILGLLASGHNISSDDTAQIKFIGEAIIFLATGLALLNKKLNSDIIILILLTLTTLSLIDIYLEIMQEGNSVGVTAIFIVLLIMTLYHGFVRVKRTVK
jgi:hypothetical protein